MESHSPLPTAPWSPPPPLPGPAVDPPDLCYAEIRSTVQVPTNGNSLFTSVSISKWATPAAAPALRRAAVLFVLRNWAHFKESIVLPGLVRTPTPEEYAQHMRRDGASAAEVEVQALARILNVIIAVYTPDGKHVYSPFGRPEHTIFLKFFPRYEGHFEPFPFQPIWQQLERAATDPPKMAPVSSRGIQGRTASAPLRAVQHAVPHAAGMSTRTARGWITVSSRRGPGCYVVAPVMTPQLRLSSRFAALHPEVQVPDGHAPAEQACSRPPPPPPPPPNPPPPPSCPPCPRPSSAQSSASRRRRRRRRRRPAGRQPTCAPAEPRDFSPPPREHVEVTVSLPFGKAQALVDSGSTYSFVSARLLAARDIVKHGQIPRLQAAAGSVLRVQGAYPATVRWNGRKHAHTFLVCKDLAQDVILGLDWLCSTQSVLDFRSGRGTVVCSGLSETVRPITCSSAVRDNFARAAEYPPSPLSPPFPPSPPPIGPRAITISGSAMCG